MGQVLALEELMAARQVWQGHGTHAPEQGIPTGHAELDQALPLGGWPRAALSEILLPAAGIGEITLLAPTLTRLTQQGERIVLVAPPCIPYAPAWRVMGVQLSQLEIVTAEPRDALWAFEQCLRAGSCAAVLGWPDKADHQILRRLQVAAGTGRSLGFVLRAQKHAGQASPAALRLAMPSNREVQVVKCRGGHAPSRTFRLWQ